MNVKVEDIVQDAVRALAIRHETGPLGVVTLSAGVASWCLGRLTVTPAWLVGAADAALYEAKAQGRNTFAVCPNAGTAAPAPPIARKDAA